ncbi:hypothetical protein QF026_000502 [Streptomyces aurantiacus]|nr:hypothetical protein [Streptomyces aurantiacus]MDQ0772036.1 hypothetical protein [Streptomyces aurantiacus]
MESQSPPVHVAAGIVRVLRRIALPHGILSITPRRREVWSA